MLECAFLKSSAKEHAGKEPCRVPVMAETCLSKEGAANLSLQITDKYSQSDGGIR